MAHYKTAILFITWYYSIKAWCTFFLYSCTHFVKHIRSYNENWIILPGHAIPQSRIVNPIQDSWVYNVSRRVLHTSATTQIVTQIVTQPVTQSYKLSWLSVKLVILRSGQSDHIVREEYDMDPFFETFRVHGSPAICPTLHTLFMTWCISTSHWIPSTDTVQFHLIDHLGDERIIPLTSMVSFDIRQNKLYDRISPK